MAPKMRMAPPRLQAAASGRLTTPVNTDRSAKRVDSFYVSPKWKAFLKKLIEERGRRCQDPKCATPRGPWKMIYGHHKVELADGGAPLDRTNVDLVCGPCHGRLTFDNKKKRAGWIDIVAKE